LDHVDDDAWGTKVRGRDGRGDSVDKREDKVKEHQYSSLDASGKLGTRGRRDEKGDDPLGVTLDASREVVVDNEADGTGLVCLDRELKDNEDFAPTGRRGRAELLKGGEAGLGGHVRVL
jgi:hypothetical protein